MKNLLKILFSALILSLVSFYHSDILAEINMPDIKPNQETKSSFADYWWIEFSGQMYSSKTDFYIDPDKIIDEDKLSNYFFVNPSLKIGYRFELSKFLKLPENTKFYLDIYFNNNLIWDVYDKNINKLYWNNNFVYGPGIRLRIPLKSYNFLKDTRVVKDLNFDFFAEYLNIDYLPKVEHSVTHRPKNDFIYGISLYSLLEGNLRTSDIKETFLNNWYAEVGVGYAYHRNNLFIKDFKNFYIFNSSITLGLPFYKGRIDKVPGQFFDMYLFDIYYKTLFAWDIGDKSWNDVDWNNYIKYGPGLNLLKIKSEPKKSSNLLKKANFEIFLEYLNIYYLDKVKYIPSYKPDHDILCGIRFFIPIGGKGII